MSGGEGRDVVWVNGRPLAMPTASAQNFTSPPQQSNNLNNPTQGFTMDDDAVNFSLPKHMQDVVGSGENPSTDDLQALAADAPTPHKFTRVAANPLLDQPNPLPRSGQGPAWHAHGGVMSDPEQSEQSVSPQPSSDPADVAQTVTAGLGAKLKAQLAALREDSKPEAALQEKSAPESETAHTVPSGLGSKLKLQLAALRAESPPQQEVEMTSTSQSQSRCATLPQHTQAEHQTPSDGAVLVSPPDSVQGDDADSDLGASASERTWSAGMGQDLGKQLQARLARSRKPPGTAKPPIHRTKPNSEQTWSAGMGAGLGSQLRQQLAQLRAEGKKGEASPSVEGLQSQQHPGACVGPRDADKFPAQPVRVPWTAPIPESSEQTWTDSLGTRMRQQLSSMRGLGNDTSVPLPRAQPRPSLFDLFSDQPVSDKPTWSAGIGEKMRRQLEELQRRDIEDSAHAASTSSQEHEPVRSSRQFNTASLPAGIPASEQTWTAGMGNAAKRELLQRRSVMRRNNSSPDIEQEAEAAPNFKSQTAEGMHEAQFGGKEYLQQDNLDFHHLEEIPHVRHHCSSLSLADKSVPRLSVPCVPQDTTPIRCAFMSVHVVLPVVMWSVRLVAPRACQLNCTKYHAGARVGARAFGRCQVASDSRPETLLPCQAAGRLAVGQGKLCLLAV